MAPRRSRLVLVTGAAIVLLLFWHLRASGSRPSVPFIPSSYDWSTLQPFHPPTNIKPLPTNPPGRLPRVQAEPSAFKHDETTERRRNAVRDEFIRSYRSYKEYAWMKDEVTPLTAGWKNTFGGWAATLVDSLDTLWIMDLKTDFYAAAAGAASIDWSATEDGAANVFETTIRHLGGLLSAYDLSREPALLRKARELGEMLYVAFDTPNRLPGFWLNYRDARNGRQVAGTHDPSASPGSLTLEMTRLSQLTGDPKFYDAADRVTRFLERVQHDSSLPGMWPVSLDFRSERIRDARFSLGALADSLYEYLPKMHALLGGADPTYAKMYRAAADAAQNLLFRPMLPEGSPDVLFAGDLRVSGDRPDLVPDGQHLTCFAGGMYALGGRLLSNEDHVAIGARLARGCGWAYASFPTGVMPEIFGLIPCRSGGGGGGSSLNPCAWDEERWHREGDYRLPRGFKHARDPRYILRPEAIESIFIMYRLTGHREWQDMAWTMFEAITAVTRTEVASAAIKDVTDPASPKMDSMEVSPDGLGLTIESVVLLLMVLAELLACRDAEILLHDLLPARSHQPRRVRPQHGGAPIKEGMRHLLLIMLFL